MKELEQHIQQREVNAIGPAQDLITAIEWQEWIAAHFQGFKGDLIQAGVLMAELIAGETTLLKS